jgi:phosphoenolpyruvate synthase/pyruvate phosphate dikinase
VLAAVRTVWASPFSDRSYAWRQAHMSDPELVFPAVVVQRAFSSEKSGVLVTVDVETGDRRWLTIAVNEGVGGAVEGQAAESLRVDARSGVVRFLAPAATPEKTVLAPSGGVTKAPASGTEWVLDPKEVRQLVLLARNVPERLPSMRTPTGEPIPADIEFAFRDRRLALLQIRPFNESKRAQRSQYLASLDEGLRLKADYPISIAGRPGQPDLAQQNAIQQEEEQRLAQERAERDAERRERKRRGVR